MLPRPMRTLVAVLATLGLIGALTAIPVAAETAAPTCSVTPDGSTTELVTDGVELTFDSDFACTDAAPAGDWSITVNVTNTSGSDVTIDEISLSSTSPPFGDSAGNTLDVDALTLPLPLAAGASSSFDASGTYALAETGEGALRNLHLRAAGTASDSAPFVLGINVHVLGPGVEMEEDDEGEGSGRPEWAPGPPPWVFALFERLAAGGLFPFDGFPGALGEDRDDEAETGDAGPPAGLTLPSQAGGDVTLPPEAGSDEDESGAEAGSDGSSDAGPPEWVSPGGPPESVPGAARGGRP